MPCLLHRYGVFSRASGRALTYGYSWTASEMAPPDSRHIVSMLEPGADPADLYHLPLDDQEAHWRRLYSEFHIWAHPDHRLSGAAHPAKLRHTGGAPHPDQARYRHVRLGGVLTWDAPPHPLVQAHLDEMAALSDDDLFDHFCGPQWRRAGHLGVSA